MGSKQHVVPRPRLHDNKWVVWKDTIIDVYNVLDCDNTTSGVCFQSKTLKECMKGCDGECAAGYYIKLSNGQPICVRTRSLIIPEINPVYRLINKNSLDILKNHEVSTFVNRHHYETIPDEANSIFFHDIINLINVESGKAIGYDYILRGGNDIFLSDKYDRLKLQLFKTDLSDNRLSIYLKLKYDSPFKIMLPETTLLLETDAKLSRLTFNISNIMEKNPRTIFKLIRTNSSSNFVSYDDIFYIRDEKGRYVVVNKKTSKLEVKDSVNIENGINSLYNYKFKFINNMRGYYCDNNICKSVKIRDTVTDKRSARYNNILVTRHPNCINSCGVYKHIKSVGSTSIEKHRGVLYIIKLTFGVLCMAISIIFINYVIRI